MIQEAQSIADYIGDLYSNRFPSLQDAALVRDLNHRLIITPKIIASAVQKLSKDNAKGDDGLQDSWLKNPRIFNQIKFKLIAIFQDWLDGG